VGAQLGRDLAELVGGGAAAIAVATVGIAVFSLTIAVFALAANLSRLDIQRWSDYR
jgi:hypothetical protein